MVGEDASSLADKRDWVTSEELGCLLLLLDSLDKFFLMEGGSVF